MAEQKLIEALQGQYGGKWVALKDGEVVASAETSREVLRQVQKQQLGEVFLIYCPRLGEQRPARLLRGCIWR